MFAKTRPPLVALVLERPSQAEGGFLEASRRFHLSPREYQTVVHRMKGLTTKEIAQQMDVSPNTVRQFIRLIMSKMRGCRWEPRQPDPPPHVVGQGEAGRRHLGRSCVAAVVRIIEGECDGAGKRSGVGGVLCLMAADPEDTLAPRSSRRSHR